jgi:hypothetical protein
VVAVSLDLSLIRRTALRYTLLSAALACVLAVAAPWGVPLVFGHAFEPAVELVWILLPGFVAQSYAYIVDAGMVGLRKPWVGNAAQGAGVVITASMLPILLPTYGAKGAAITSTVSYTVSAVISVWALGRIWRSAATTPDVLADHVVPSETPAGHGLVPQSDLDASDFVPLPDVVVEPADHRHDAGTQRHAPVARPPDG